MHMRRLSGFAAVGRPAAWTFIGLAALLIGCGGSGLSPTGGTGGKLGTGGGGPGPGSGTGGMMMPGKGMGPGMGMMGQGNIAGASATCSGSSLSTVVLDCGYPSSASALSGTAFNEDDVLRAIVAGGSSSGGVVKVFYNDEHALTLGVRSVVVTSPAGSTSTDYTVAGLPADPGMVTNPKTGTNVLSGDQSGLDQSLRPMWPALFITDVTNNPGDRSGDWQMGGKPIGPNAVYGTWKSAVRTVDKTVSPASVTITPDADPAKNDWNLAGGDTPPSGLGNEGYGAEMVWNVPLQAGHSYRVQVLVHDGDQNKAGGDAGEGCALFCAGSGGDCEATNSCGGGTNKPTCPEGVAACGPGGIDPVSCPQGSACANGCCLSIPIS
jgi:hypothetical protein